MTTVLKDEDFPYIDDTMRRFQSLSEIKEIYPDAILSKDFYCPKCGKHPTYHEDIPIAYSALIHYFGKIDSNQKGKRSYWYEVVDCDNCKDEYIFKNQNF